VEDQDLGTIHRGAEQQSEMFLPFLPFLRPDAEHQGRDSICEKASLG